MKKIAVVGGTGMLGSPVARQFLNDGFDVRIISRNAISAKEKLGEGFEFVQADIFDQQSLSKALQGCQGIHINLTGNSSESYYKNHVAGTKNILASVDKDAIALISMISTASAYPENDFRADTKYKLEAEELLKKSGFEYLVFLPSWFMESLPLFVQKDKVIHIGKSTQKIHWQTANDYAGKVSEAYQDKTCRNKRITIFGPEPLTMKQAVKRYAEHKNLTYQAMPVWLAKMFAWLSKDADLKDAADLLQYYEQVGEKVVRENTGHSVIRTNETLDDWLLGG